MTHGDKDSPKFFMKFRKVLHRLNNGGPVLVFTFLNFTVTPTLTEDYPLRLIILAEFNLRI
jgi:hypothetical protein